MFQTVIIPIMIGVFCFVIATLALNIVMPFVPLDDFSKGIIKIAVWVISFVLPIEYFHKRAKKKIASNRKTAH